MFWCGGLANMEHYFKTEVMLMKYVSLALCVGLFFLGREYYRAVRHEFYQVWDSMSELKGDNNATSR